MDKHGTTRFSNRVEDYVKYRPGYPAGIIPYLEAACGLKKDSLIADIGAGTGISTTLFLNAGYSVAAVEPNKEMREKAISLLGDNANFMAVDGTAEHTTLSDHSVATIVAGQAFHWFDREMCKTEFKRILMPGGWVVLIWNERKTASAFEKEYDALIVKHARDYVQVDHRNIDKGKIDAFFSPGACSLKIFANKQEFDFDGLLGRLSSSSYMPVKDDSGYEAMAADLKDLFERYAQNNNIIIEYETKVYTGQLV